MQSLEQEFANRKTQHIIAVCYHSIMHTFEQIYANDTGVKIPYAFVKQQFHNRAMELVQSAYESKCLANLYDQCYIDMQRERPEMLDLNLIIG